MDSQGILNFSYCSDPKFKLKVLKQNVTERCDICLLSEWKPLRYGEFIVKNYRKNRTLKCHYFCLLSGTFIHQRGKEFAGIAGFLIQDVLNSLDEFRNKQCVYCCHPSAPIRCSGEGCNRWFHYICGYKNACLTKFCGAYESFCDQHLPPAYGRPLQTENIECEICYEPFLLPTDANYNPVAIMRTCGIEDCPPGLMHRECVQQSAYSAGYRFKCPCCLSYKYKSFAEEHGIFVPNRETSWEREQGAFKDTDQRNCTASDCPFGTGNHTSSVVGCKLCGGDLMHKACTKLKDPMDYTCKGCMNETIIKLW